MTPEKQLILKPINKEPPVRQHTTNDTVPPEIKAQMLPDMELNYCEYQFGSILTQKSDIAGYSFWYHEFKIDQQTELETISNIPMVSLVYILNGNLHCSKHELSIQANRYQLNIMEQDVPYSVILPPGFYQYFQLALPGEVLSEFAWQIDRLNDPKNHVFFINADIKKCIGEILNFHNLVNRYTHHRRSSYFAERLFRLTNFYIKDRDRWSMQSQKLSNATLKLEDLKMYIVENFSSWDSNSSALKDILKMVGMPVVSFRMYIDEVYATTWEQFFHQLRMQKAMALVLKRPYQKLTSIAYELGYNTQTNFTRAFTKFYGNQPSFYRN